VIGGTFRPDRHGALALVAAGAPSSCMPGRETHQKETRRLLRGLSRPTREAGQALLVEFTGWGTADLVVLRLLLEELDRGAQCRAHIQTECLVLPGTRGVARPHPRIRMERQSRALAAALIRQLNLGGVK